jgi:hypothetical protein
VHPLHEIHVPQAPNEITEQPLPTMAWLERSTQLLSDECARIVHTLRNCGVDSCGDAKEVIGALQRVTESLDGMVASACMLWTWQDLLKVRHRCPYTLA